MRCIALLFVLFTTQLFAQNQTIKGPDYSYKCPKNWILQHYNGLLAVTTPLDGFDDRFADNINVLSQPQSMFSNVGLDEYVQINIDQLESSGIQAIQRSEYIAGKKKLKGYLLVYTTDVFSKGAYQQKVWQVFVVYNQKYFVVTYSSLPETFLKYLPQMEMVVATIVFK